VAAHVVQHFDAGFVAHQHQRVVGPPQGVIVADVRHHQLMAYIAWPVVEQHALLELEQLLIEIPGHRKLRLCRFQTGNGLYIGHSPTLEVKVGKPRAIQSLRFGT